MSDFAFNESGSPEPSVEFDYDAIDGEAPQPATPARIDTDRVRVVLFHILGDSERGCRSRLAAVMTLTGFFKNGSEAARKCKVTRSTLAKAVRSMRRALRKCHIDLPKKR